MTLNLIFFNVGLSGLEPPTFRVSGERSDQLSYKPIIVRNRTPHLTMTDTGVSTVFLSGTWDSNLIGVHRPLHISVWHDGVLTLN